jgi:uncharacterized membrane protein YsdA (DUF1294 family)
MLESAVTYLLIANLVSFLTCAWDKLCSMRGWWRVSESTLLLLAFVGGSLGAIAAQQGLRHKSYKEPFRSQLWTIGVLHMVAAVVMAVPASREVVLNWLSDASGRRF